MATSFWSRRPVGTPKGDGHACIARSCPLGWGFCHSVRWRLLRHHSRLSLTNNRAVEKPGLWAGLAANYLALRRPGALPPLHLKFSYTKLTVLSNTVYKKYFLWHIILMRCASRRLTARRLSLWRIK